MLMRRVGASYERCDKAKMQGVRFEKLTDHRELLSIPRSITHLNWKPEKGRDYHRQETTPRSIQVIQPEECGFFGFSERGKATFSVGLYGENEAFRLAAASRHAGLRDLGDIS
jgi:hypothetical protein